MMGVARCAAPFCGRDWFARIVAIVKAFSRIVQSSIPAQLSFFRFFA
jgi:hypothetical protein